MPVVLRADIRTDKPAVNIANAACTTITVITVPMGIRLIHPAVANMGTAASSSTRPCKIVCRRLSGLEPVWKLRRERLGAANGRLRRPRSSTYSGICLGSASLHPTICPPNPPASDFPNRLLAMRRLIHHINEFAINRMHIGGRDKIRIHLGRKQLPHHSFLLFPRHQKYHFAGQID